MYEWSLCTLCGSGLGGGMKGYCAPAQSCLGPVTTVATINLKLLSCQRLAADVALSLLSRWPIIPPWRHIQSLYVERESGLITFWEISFLHPNLGLLPHVILFVSSHSPLARCCLCEIWWWVGGAVGWSQSLQQAGSPECGSGHHHERSGRPVVPGRHKR